MVAAHLHTLLRDQACPCRAGTACTACMAEPAIAVAIGAQVAQKLRAGGPAVQTLQNQAPPWCCPSVPSLTSKRLQHLIKHLLLLCQPVPACYSPSSAALILCINDGEASTSLLLLTLIAIFLRHPHNQSFMLEPVALQSQKP